MDGQVDLGLRIAPDLSEKIRRGETSEIQVLVDGTVSNMAAIRVSYVMTVLDRLNRQFLKELYPFQMTYGPDRPPDADVVQSQSLQPAFLRPRHRGLHHMLSSLLFTLYGRHQGA